MLQRQAQNALEGRTERRRGSSFSSIHSFFSDVENNNDVTSSMEQGQSPAAAFVYNTEITYQDYLTPREEIVRLSEGIEAFYVHQPQQDVLSMDNHMATANSIQGSLMINPDGSLQPLSWRQRLIYRSSQEKLEQKIERAKKEALVIVKEVNRPHPPPYYTLRSTHSLSFPLITPLSPPNNLLYLPSHTLSIPYYTLSTPSHTLSTLSYTLSTLSHTLSTLCYTLIVAQVEEIPRTEEVHKDVALIHHFILENVHWFYRISLRQNLFGFEIPPQVIKPLPWMAAWAFVIFSMGFFLYWTFAWGLTNGSECLGAWGLYFGLNMVEDIFFTQVVKILILKVLAIIGLRPQLRVIRRVITDATMSLSQDASGSGHAVRSKGQIQIIQFFSASCRAARSKALFDQPAAAILRQVKHTLSTHPVNPSYQPIL